MSDKATRKKILTYLYDVYKTQPSIAKSTDEITDALGISQVEAKGALIYLHQKELIDSFADDNYKWYQKINANGIDELEKSDSEITTSNTNDFRSLDIEPSEDRRMYKMSVFISHKFSPKDLELAVTLKKLLKEREIYGYIAEVRPEYDLRLDEKIQKEIRDSHYVVGIITNESRISASVNQELGYALGYGIPLIIMVEKNVKHGILTESRETQEFTIENFSQPCKRIIDYIVEKRIPEKVSDDDKKWLKENVYTTLYNKMMKLHKDPDKFSKLPVDPWKELEPVAVKRCENDVKNLFNEFSIELDKWKTMLSTFLSSFTINKNRLAEIVKTAFEKAGLIRPDGYIVLSAGSAQEPKDWIDTFRFIIFDDSITNEEILYKKLLNFAKETNNGHQQWIQDWETNRSPLFSYLVDILPQLRTELKIDTTNELLLRQKNQLNSIIEKIIKVLEDRI